MSLEVTCQLDHKNVEKPFLPFLFGFKITAMVSFYTMYELSKMGEAADYISYHYTKQLFPPSDQNYFCLYVYTAGLQTSNQTAQIQHRIELRSTMVLLTLTSWGKTSSSSGSAPQLCSLQCRVNLRQRTIM